jgi:hypothetical protein
MSFAFLVTAHSGQMWPGRYPGFKQNWPLRSARDLFAFLKRNNVDCSKPAAPNSGSVTLSPVASQIAAVAT